MNRNYLKAALAGTSDDSTRRTLQGVLLQRNSDNVRIVSTDGHVLFRSEIEQKIEDAPCNGEHGAIATINDTILPPETCQAVLKLCQKSKGSPNTELYIGDSVAKVNLEHTIPFSPVDDTFPAYEKAIPERRGYVFTVDVAILESLVKYAKAIREAKDQKHGPFGIRFFTESPERGIRFELQTSDYGEGKFDGVIMPIKDLPSETKESV